MNNYIDGFAFPIHRDHLIVYKSVAQKVAEIWKEYGAIQYLEFVGDELNVEGTKSFAESINSRSLTITDQRSEKSCTSVRKSSFGTAQKSLSSTFPSVSSNSTPLRPSMH